LKNLIQLKNEGYTLLKNVFSETEVLSWRKHLLEYMSVKSNRCKSENWLSVKPNAINYTEFSDHLTIFENKNLISFLKEACGGVLKYAHHYDVHLDTPAYGFHHDGGIRHLNQKFKYKDRKGWDDTKLRNYIKEKYDLTYEELCGTNDWKTYANPTNDYNNKHSIKGEELLVYRVGIYLQNHKTEGGLQVLSESHKKSSKSCKSVYIPSEIGDVVIWNCKTFHQASNNTESGRGFVHMAFGKPNFLLDMYSEGHSARLTNQNGEDEYKLSNNFKKVLDKMEILY